MKTGKASVIFQKPPCIIGAASVVGKKEGDGPLREWFDQIEEDDMFGQPNWDQAECECQKRAFLAAMQDADFLDDVKPDFLFAGDLLNQLTATAFGLKEFQIPLFGLYGACSTMGEAICLAALFLEAEAAECTAALTSSHYASAQKQFRFPLGYGNQRPFSASWTVTGAGAVILARDLSENSISRKIRPYAAVTAVTAGKPVDYGVKDSFHMGAAMAPAAADTILQHMSDLSCTPEDYDCIVTGDLGSVGQTILFELLERNGLSIEDRHWDCGMKIYESTQDVHAGGSGCGCSAAVLCGYILKRLLRGEWKRVLFVPTGALFSPISFNEKMSIPGIAHAVVLESSR